MSKEHHKVLVTRIGEVEKHGNADSLGVVRTSGYQTVVKLGEFQPGDLAIYIPPDSVVPEISQFSFLWAGHDFDGQPVPVKYRRVRAKKLRKEWSEGLLMPVSDFPELYSHTAQGNKRFIDLQEGQDVSDILGITHYEPPEEPEKTTGENERGPQYHRWPKSLKGWFYFILRKIGIDLNRGVGGDNIPAPGGIGLPVYDVEAMKNFMDKFTPGEEVRVTEKIHGSNARFTFRNGKMYAGSRKLWKSPKAKYTVWRKVLEQHPWIELWCRSHEGYVLYGEVVPTQGGFNYGTRPGETDFFVFDILTPEGEWVDVYKLRGESRYLLSGLQWVPVLYEGGFDHEVLKKLVDGPSTIGDHIREGIVVKPQMERHVTGLGRLQLKLVSNDFYNKD